MKEKKAFKQLLKITGLKLYMGLQRYPVAIVFAAAASIVSIVMIHNENMTEDTERLLVSTIMAFVLGMVISLVIKTIFEHNEIRQRFKYFIWIIFSCGVFLYAMYLNNSMYMMEKFEAIRFTALMLAAIVLFMAAVFRKKTKYQEVYSTVTGWRLAITAIYTLVIWGGVSLILFAIERLLNVDVDEKLYIDTVVLAMGFFAPIFFLGGVPDKKEQLAPEHIYKFFKILVLYVIAPLLTAYTIVFYIYVLRLLFNWNWPDGIVANMVLWYALIGTVTMYFLHGMNAGGKWVAVFGKWFPRVVLLPVVLLFISLGIRVNAYGFTVNRYLLGAVGVWMLGSMIYMSIVNYKKRNTRIITISLVVIVALSVVGPWNAISVGRYSQTNRLEKLLVENSMLLNGQIVKAGENISDEDKVQISTMLKFLENEYNYKGVEFIPENFTTKKMEEVMGFEYVYDYDYIRNPKEMGMVFIDEIMTGGIINISGYDYAWSTDGGSNSYIDTEKGKLEIEYIREQDGSHLNIELNNTIILKEYTHKYIEAIYNTWKEVGENITLEDMSFVTGTDEVDVKIVFTALEVYDDDESLESGWQKITVLVKFK